MSRSDVVWTLNLGSSSLKAAAFLVTEGRAEELARASEERPSGAQASVASFRRVTESFASRFAEPAAIAHRLVHGGPRRFDPVIVDDSIARELRGAIDFAPLHLPSELDLLDAARAARPNAACVAVFDTGFHRTLPGVARRFALPRALYDRGIVRYGFHGLSCQSVVLALGDSLGERSVIAHLGSGSSLTALRSRKSIDNTMGLTPSGGLPMETRSGDLDPGVLIRLLRDGLDVDALARLVDHESGLCGISGGVSDVRELLAKRATDVPSQEAIETFVYAIRKGIAAMAGALGGLDSVVFTGGIGERSSVLRGEICDGLAFLGVLLDQERNGAHDPVISREVSSVEVRVVAADEERVLALAGAACARNSAVAT